jgi:hypothetical protein
VTVDQLREALASMPGHLPVHIDSPVKGTTSAEVEYLYTLDCQLEAFPTQGRMVVITINPEPT